MNRKLQWSHSNIDVEQQLATEKALRQSETTLHDKSERLAAALEASDTGTFCWNPRTGEFLEFDDNLKQLFGKGPDAQFRVTGDFVKSVHQDDRDALIAALDACRWGADFCLEYRVVLADASIRWLYERAKMEWENDKPAYLFGACTDVTRRKLAEEALIKSEKLAAMGRLAGVMAHEINNPLEAVTNLAYLLRDNSSLDDEARNLVQLLEKELARMAHIARQSLGFYRESAKPVPVSLAGVLEEVLELYEPRLRKSRISVEKKYGTREGLLSMPGEMRQVFLNLIGNAIEVMPSGGRLRIHLYYSADREHSGFRVHICDTGAGIKLVDAKKIFDPFFTTKGQKGTGLGLWVTRGIINKHGGSIRFRTSRLVSGAVTCFSVFLPGHSVPCAPTIPLDEENAA